MLRKPLKRWPSSCFLSLFHRKSFSFAMYYRSWSGRMWFKHSCVHTRILLHCSAPPRDGRCCNAFVRFNKTYQEVLLISNVFNILDILFKMTYPADFLIWVSLKTIRLRWCPGGDFFKNSRRKVVALSASNTIKSMFIRTMFCLTEQWEYIEGLLDDTKSFSDHIHLGLGDPWRQLIYSM